MKVLPFNAENWEIYKSWFTTRGISPPLPPKRGIFIGRDDNTMLVGACCYTGEDRYMRLEHASFDINAGTHEVVDATEFMIAVSEGLASIIGKFIMVITDTPYINKSLNNAGFTRCQDHVVWVGIPGQMAPPKKPVDEVKEGKPEAPTKKPKVGTCVRCKNSFIKVTGREKLCPDCKRSK
jgi:hypothetical protein